MDHIMKTDTTGVELYNERKIEWIDFFDLLQNQNFNKWEFIVS
jgi:hypothetical protein